jgi:TP53 regulating kinase-like protein/N6-L-threonylcarbamoyladenine synthase/protein kinase Bud32
MQDNDILGCGAEATVYRTTYLGRDAVVKTRVPKGYRHPELDLRLRSARTKHESKVMIEARKAGVRTPVIYDIDVRRCDITMEYISGRKIKDVLDKEPSEAKELCIRIGKEIAKLHNVGISHGDLTTSNMILMPDGEICIFDLSLGSAAADIEDLGVDIHLLQRAFTSAHSGLDNGLEALMDSYSKHMNDSKNVLKRVDDIRGRARYT